MREFLASGQFGSIELNEQKLIREKIANRWSEVGFLDGLNGHVRDNIATLYENQAKVIMNEATSSENSGSFETVVFPIIRRVFSKLLANDIVSVQAMNLPIGKLFFMLPVTSERQWDPEFKDGAVGRHAGLMGYTRENRYGEGAENGVITDKPTEDRFYLPDEVVNDGAKVTQYMKKTLYDLFYNDFLFDNSKGKIHIKVGAAEVVGWDKYGELSKDGENKYMLHADGTVRNLVIAVQGFSQVNKGKLTGPDGNEMDTEAFLASLKVIAKNGIEGTETASFKANEAIPFRVMTQKYGKGIVEYTDAVDQKGTLYIELDLAKPVVQAGKTLDGYIGITEAAAKALVRKGDESKIMVAWSQYDSLELETEIGEVSFKLDSVTVSVEERKLRATWSPELAQDVAAFHNIDAEAELTAILSEQIAAEIDREILRDLRSAAPWQKRWDVNGWRRMAAFSTNYTQKDWNQELMTAINQISAQIHKSTLRGGANFVVVSSEISAIFDNLEYFHVSDASAESDQYNMGIEKVGSLSGRYQVYRDPYSPAWSIIIGHKGKSLLDTGYIYAPYIPMQLTPTIINPENFAPVKGIMTRYAKKCVNNRFYGAIKVDGLVQWDPQELR
jgi:hypothetical protein